MDNKENCFDILRYYGALSIMLLHFSGHMMIEMGNEAYTLPLHWMRVVVSYYPGLIILFVISGFFGAYSMDRSSSVRMFLKKKFMRIYPELWTCMLVMLLSTFLILGKSAFGGSTFLWIIVQGLGISFTPGILKTYGTGSFNGTLWTIFVQIQFFLIISLGWKYIKGKISKRMWILIIFPATVFMNLLAVCFNGKLPLLDLAIERSVFPYLLWFSIGVFGYLYKDELTQVLRRAFIPMILVYAVGMFFYNRLPASSLWSSIWDCGYYSGVLRSIICGFTFLTLGFGCLPILPKGRIKIDFSYELFLYHWLVLNAILHFDLYEKAGWGWCLVIFLFGTAALSVLSKKILRTVHLENRKNVKENA